MSAGSIGVHLLQQWKDSLTLFKPRNFKVLMREAFRCVWQVYTSVLYWLLLIVYIGVFLGLYIINQIVPEYAGALPAWFSYLLWKTLTILDYFVPIFMVVVIAFIMHSAITKKNAFSLYDYHWHIGMMTVIFFVLKFNLILLIGILLALMVVTLLYRFFWGKVQSIGVMCCQHIKTYSCVGSILILLYFLIHNSILFPFFYFIILLYCDTPGRLHDFGDSCVRAIKTLWYHVPFFAFLIGLNFAFFVAIIYSLGALYHFLWQLSPQLFGGQGGQFWGFLGMMIVPFIFLPIPCSFVSSFYTKKVHDYSEQFLG